MTGKKIRWILLLALLLSCTKMELPPSPPPPGEQSVGRAIGGIAISNTTLPSWAGPVLYTDVEPAAAKEGQTIRVVVEKPSFVTTKFYAHAIMYALNKKAGVWEKITADTKDSGKIVQQWAENKAVFTFKADPTRHILGNNFLLTYWCIDTDTRDTNENKIWNCNGRKWGLGAFEMKPLGYPELIEQDIGNNKYKNSSKTETGEGAEYEATYHGTGDVRTTVKVTKLKDYPSVKRTMAGNLPLLESIWTQRGSTCGFLQTDRSTTTFTWFTNDSRIIVQTFSATLDESKVIAYASKYASNCKLVEEVKRIAAGSTGYCGNENIEQPEQCDLGKDSVCPGLCKPDCSCAVEGEPGVGTCGDFMIQKPNNNSAVENCEPPEKRDPVTGQVQSGSICFIRDVFTSKIKEIGHCNDQCGCIPGTASLKKCGNGNCETGEDPANCPVDCPVDTAPPSIKVSVPTPNQTFSTADITYNVSAVDVSGVKLCEAKTNNGTAEQMTQSGILWHLKKTLAQGNHAVSITCTDWLNKTAVVSAQFTVTLPPPAPSQAATSAPATNASNATNGTTTAGAIAGNAAATKGTQECVDSDGGRNYESAGKVDYKAGSSNSDTCVDASGNPVESGPSLTEYSCEGTGKEVYMCPNGCKAGACVKPCVSTQGQACNRNQCGGSGVVQCDGSCSSAAPALPWNFGQSCNCNTGTIQCNGQCSGSGCQSGYTCQNNQCVADCSKCILAPSTNCNEACIAHGQASGMGYNGGHCGSPGSTNPSACCSCTCNGQVCAAGQACIGGQYCGTPCSGCLGGKTDCNQACQSLGQGYTSGKCERPSSTDTGACCSCTKPTYTAPSYTSPTYHTCSDYTTTCRYQGSVQGGYGYYEYLYRDGQQTGTISQSSSSFYSTPQCVHKPVGQGGGSCSPYYGAYDHQNCVCP